MRLRYASASAVLLVVAGLLPVPGGCGAKTACITVSRAAYEKAGACPTIDEAMVRFGTCAGPVLSVEGDGVWDADLCCYAVRESEDDDSPPCAFGGAGGFGGVGGSGGAPDCLTCLAAFDTPGADPVAMCNDALLAWSNLRDCACSPGGPCEWACSADACAVQVPSADCYLCLQDAGGCPALYADCAAH